RRLAGLDPGDAARVALGERLDHRLVAGGRRGGPVRGSGPGRTVRAAGPGGDRSTDRATVRGRVRGGGTALAAPSLKLTHRLTGRVGRTPPRRKRAFLPDSASRLPRRRRARP